MLPQKYRKPALATLMASLLLAGCSGNDTNEDLVRVRANLDLAEVYRDQGQFRASIIEVSNALQLMPDNVDAIKLSGDLYLQIGDVQAAVDTLSHALTLAPNDPGVKLLLAQAYLSANRFADAQAQLDGLNVSGAELIHKNRLQGNLLASTGDSAAAQALLEANLAQAPDDIDTLIALSKLEYQAGNVGAAQDYVDQAVQVGDRDHVDLWIWRGQMALLQQNYPEAESAFYEALDLMALYDVMTAKRFMTLQNIVVPLQMQGKGAEALRYSELIASSPQGELMNRFSTAATLFEQGSMEAAQVELENLLALAPDHAQTNILLGVTQFQQGNLQEAAQLLGRFASSASATPQVVKTLAATHLRLNEPDKALSVLTQAQENNPEDASLPAMRALIHQQTGDLDAAIAVIDEAQARHPDSPELLLALAGTQASREDLDGAVASLQRALSINPAYQEAKVALINLQGARNDLAGTQAMVDGWLREEPDSTFNLLAAAVTAERLQNLPAARTYFERALALEPDNAQTMLNLARLDVEAGNYPGALSRLETLLEKEPGNALALNGLLTVHRQAGSSEAGVQRLEALNDAHPETTMPAQILAQYHATTGNLAEARRYADAALSRQRNSATLALAVGVRVEEAARAAGQNPAQARQHLQDALGLAPDAPAALALAARLEAEQGNQSAAQDYLTRLRSAQPQSHLSYEVEGDLARGRGDVQGALAAYRQGWQLQPVPAVAAKLYQLLASSSGAPEAARFLQEEWRPKLPQDPAALIFQALEQQSANRVDDAIASYEGAYQSLPNNLLVLNNLAWLYQDSNPQRALELARRGAELYPEDAQMLDTLGWVLYRQDQREEAVRVLERASALAPTSTEISEHLEQARR